MCAKFEVSNTNILEVIDEDVKKKTNIAATPWNDVRFIKVYIYIVHRCKCVYKFFYTNTSSSSGITVTNIDVKEQIWLTNVKYL